jgi:Xaa-Pro aminopeptidase
MIERPTREPARPSTEGAPVTAKDFARRRLEALSRMGDAVLVLRSNPEQTRSADTHFPFRQDSDFLYLCGFSEPDSVLVLTPKHPEHRFVLFVRPRDLEKETWNGRRAGVLGAVERFGADAAFPIGELDQRLPAYLDGASSVYFTPGLDDEFNRRMEAILAAQRRVRARSGKGPVVRVEHGQALHPMRLFKTAEELPLLRAACEISSLAHNAALAATLPGQNEREVEALVNYTFRKAGGDAPGYNSIVAGGVNATILHYTENNMPLAAGELLLIDAGCEVGGYTADITRTFPVGAHFSEDQRAVYDIVLAAQEAAIAVVKPGTRFDDVHHAALTVLVAGLVKLGVLAGNVDELIAEKAFQPFYMHRTSHWLGLDVHDVGLYVDEAGKSRPLEPGMVLTVEPGLYFGDTTVEYDPRWRGIGVRIEDDVLVTEKGHEVLSAAAIKDPAGIERLRAQAMAARAVAGPAARSAAPAATPRR